MNQEGLSIVTYTKCETHYHHMINDAQTRYFDEPLFKSRGTKNDLTLYGDKKPKPIKRDNFVSTFGTSIICIVLTAAAPSGENILKCSRPASSNQTLSDMPKKELR